MKFAKLMLLKLFVLGEIGLLCLLPYFGLRYVGVEPMLAFFPVLLIVLIIYNGDEKEYRSKAILNFPASTYLRRPRPPQPPESR